MEKEDFVNNFAEQFIDTDPSEINMDTKFRELEEWSSFMALSTMAMIGEKYDVILTAQEMRDASTVKNLYDLVQSKI